MFINVTCSGNRHIYILSEGCVGEVACENILCEISGLLFFHERFMVFCHFGVW